MFCPQVFLDIYMNFMVKKKKEEEKSWTHYALAKYLLVKEKLSTIYLFMCYKITFVHTKPFVS